MIEFKKENKEGFILVEFELSGSMMKPDELLAVEKRFKDLFSTKDFKWGLIISGRGPVWLFSLLTHCAHPFRWVGTMDPRLGGGIVVASHDPAIKVGNIIPVEE